jgi:pyridoxal phosphate enzyme (YggS family)
MIAEHVTRVRQRIASACLRAGRMPEEITLVAVAKTFGAEAVREAVQAGVPDIGENYVQELSAKQAALHDPGIRWHFVGHLQTNKVKEIAPWIACIQTVDSVRLGEEISRRAAALRRTIDVLVEVNTTGEQTKFGAAPGAVPALVRALAQAEHLRVTGLMTIGPFLPEAEASRPAFRLLRELRDAVAAGGHALPQLSMGMTNDFEIAIEEGATIVRVGTAIFGSRKQRNHQ